MIKSRSSCLFFATLLLACGAQPPPAPALQELGTAEVGGLTVGLLVDRPLAVGLNELYYEVRREGAPVTRAAVVQKPLMTMTSMSHACPLVNPKPEADEHGRFLGRVVFTMPSSELEPWDLTLEVTPEGEAAATSVKFEKLQIADSNARQMISLGGVNHVVTLSFEGAPKVGSNHYFVTVHRPENSMKMNFLPAEELVLVGTPEMPSMGHGSSGNVDPAHVEGGVYEGSVNFSMAGDWVLHLEVSNANGEKLGTLDWSYVL